MTDNKLICINEADENGNPTGGHTFGVGLEIHWQNGPLGRGDDRKEQNGAFVEDVIRAAIRRLEFFQASKFSCPGNLSAINALSAALVALEKRTADREKRGVEGTHEV